MGIEDAFLHDILAHPDDDTPRLIYADWLDEHNNPRGEFIRIQCALAQLSDEDPRRWPLEQCAQELLREHEAKWLPECIGTIPHVFHRGFVEEVTLWSEQFFPAPDRLFEQVPIRQLHLHFRRWMRRERPDASLAQLASLRHLARLQRLHLSGFGPELIEFFGSPHLHRLTTLMISNSLFETDGESQRRAPILAEGFIDALMELPWLGGLTALHLMDTGLTLDALRLLADSSALANLRELNINGNGLTHVAATVLAEGCLLPQLETLHLDSNLLGDAGAVAMREWPALPHLTRLSLRNNHIFADGMKALAAAPALRQLIALDLRGNIACDAGTAALASANWPTLQALNLRFNGVGDGGVRALAQSGAFSHLTRLNLTANRVTSAGARALIEAQGLPALARLDLPRNDIAAAEQRRLRERFGTFVHFLPITV